MVVPGAHINDHELDKALLAHLEFWLGEKEPGIEYRWVMNQAWWNDILQITDDFGHPIFKPRSLVDYYDYYATSIPIGSVGLDFAVARPALPPLTPPFTGLPERIYNIEVEIRDDGGVPHLESVSDGQVCI